MLLCLHEEHSVAIAHGWAKITGKPMLAIIHSNVGLMHASMAIFNAWCDRAPVLLLGANGPIDAMKRRPWIDWIHTSQDMGALVRPYTKWDDQPGSPGAALESLLRAHQIASTPPYGPTIVFLDADVQEQKLACAARDAAGREVRAAANCRRPAPADVKRMLAALKGAKHPVILAGRCSHHAGSVGRPRRARGSVEARVITELHVGAMFPTDHPLHAGQSMGNPAEAALREADVILDLDSLDLAGILKSAGGGKPLGATVIAASMDRYVHGGWSMDYQALPALDISLVVPPDMLVRALLEALGNPKRKPAASNGAAPPRAKAAGTAAPVRRSGSTRSRSR